MKKTLLFLLCLGGWIHGMFAQQPTTVQGQPYDFSRTPQALNRMAVSALNSSSDFTMDDIVFWVGEGSSKAAFAVQWNKEEEENALVWGYFFDGEKRGIDMVRDIAQADPRLYVLIELADATMGYTICGIGYDKDGDGDITLTHIPTGKVLYPSEDGVFYTLGHYDYDDYKATDSDDYWGAGWYQSYWSYWVKEGDADFAYSGLGASSRKLADGSWDGWNFARNMQTRSFKPLFPAPSAGYTSGTLFLNDGKGEGANSTISYLSPKGEWQYTLYQENNEGAKLNAPTQKALFYGNNLYLLSESVGNSKGRLIVADAAKFVHKATLEVDARCFAGATSRKGYVGTAHGIYAVDLENNTLGQLVTGTDDRGKAMDLICSNGALFALLDMVGIVVIDTETDTVKQTISGNFSFVTQSAGGAIWAASGEKLVKVDPSSFTTEEIIIPGYCKVEGAFFADVKKEVLFWTSSTNLYRYEPGNVASLESPFFTLPEAGHADKPLFSGRSACLDQLTGRLVLIAVTSETEESYLYFVDAANGDLLETLRTPEESLHPVMPFFPDTAPSISGIETSYTVPVDSDPIRISLEGKCSDKDNVNAGIFVSVSSEAPERVAAELKDNELIITPQSGQDGTTNVLLNAWSNGRMTTKKIAVTLNRALLGISLDKKEMILKKGTTDTLRVLFNPVRASNQNVSWSYSSYGIVSVSNGVVTGRGVGEGFVVAKSADGDFTDTCKVIVVNEPLTGIGLNKQATSVNVNQKDTLRAVFTPLDASNRSVTWSSDDKTVAEVNSSGIITGKKEGGTKIRIKSADGGFIDSCSVEVRFKPATGIALNKTEVVVDVNKTEYLSVSFLPWNASNKEVTWISTHPEVASVSASGAVKGLKGGTTLVIAQSKDNTLLCAVCNVTVNFYPVTGMTLNETEKTVVVGKSYFPYTTFTPSNASNQTVVCTSSDPNVLEVLSYGYIQAKAPGTATITARAADGGFESTCEVTVIASIPVTGITLSKEEIWLKVGSSEQPSRTFLPSDATNQKYSYMSDDETVATVSQYGSIRGVALGTTAVTVTTEDGGHTATCVVHVVPAVENVTLEAGKEALVVGDQRRLKAVVAPVDAVQTVSWKSSDEAVATVNESGVVTALKAGNVTIKATSTDNKNLFDSCSFEVKNQLSEEILLNETEKELYVGQGLQLSATVLPENVTNSRVRWTSSDYEVATVTSYGYVTVLKTGTAVIKAVSMDGASEVSCTVTGAVAVSGIELNVTQQIVERDQTCQLEATVRPDDATHRTVSWSSEDESVAMVDENGLVTAVKEGKTNIRALTEGGEYAAVCEVIVIYPTGMGKAFDKSVAVHPTVTTGLVHLLLPEGAQLVQVMDNAGQILQSHVFPPGEATVNLSAYNEGIYYIKIQGNVTKIIKR